MATRYQSALARRRLTTITLGLRQIVRVPSAWTAFSFDGRVYDRRDTRWIVRGGWKSAEVEQTGVKKLTQYFIEVERKTQLSA